MAPMAPILPARNAAFEVTTRRTRAGRLVFRATCVVPGCPTHVEAAAREDVTVDAHDHRAAHIRGHWRVASVAAATLRGAA